MGDLSGKTLLMRKEKNVEANSLYIKNKEPPNGAGGRVKSVDTP